MHTPAGDQPDTSTAAISGCSDGYSYSAFRHSCDVVPVQVHCPTWRDMILAMAKQAEIKRPATKAYKHDATPAISPAMYAEGATRLNENVVGWGAWIGVDIDNTKGAPWTVQDAIEALAGRQYLIYGSTQHSEARHRFRVLLPLTSTVERDDIPRVWIGMWHMLGQRIDAQCKDPSRIYYMPADWQPSDEVPQPLFDFHWSDTGLCFSIEEIVAHIPEGEVVESFKPRPPPVVLLDGLQGDLLVSLPPDFFGSYLMTPKGEHHVALYTLMVRAATWGRRKGFEVRTCDLIEVARVGDGLSPIKTAPSRWYGIEREATKALSYAASLPEAEFLLDPTGRARRVERALLRIRSRKHS